MGPGMAGMESMVQGSGLPEESASPKRRTIADLKNDFGFSGRVATPKESSAWAASHQGFSPGVAISDPSGDRRDAYNANRPEGTFAQIPTRDESAQERLFMRRQVQRGDEEQQRADANINRPPAFDPRVTSIANDQRIAEAKAIIEQLNKYGRLLSPKEQEYMAKIELEQAHDLQLQNALSNAAEKLKVGVDEFNNPYGNTEYSRDIEFIRTQWMIKSGAPSGAFPKANPLAGLLDAADKPTG